MTTLKSNNFFFTILLLLVSVAFFTLIQPYYSAIIWAVILALIFYPLRTKLTVLLRGRNGIASLITVLLICILVFIPMMIVLSSLAVEINALYQRLQTNATDLPQLLSNGIAHLPEWAKHALRENNFDSVDAIREKLSGVALSVGRYLAGSAVIIGKGTLGLTISFSLMVYLLFFLLKDGAALVKKIYEVMPLSAKIKRRLFLKFAGVARDGKRDAGCSDCAGCAGRDWFLVCWPEWQPAVGCADGVPVADPGGRYRAYLDPGCDLPLLHG